MPCPEILRAECTTAERHEQRRDPRSAYPSELKTLGDHIRKRRSDLALSQSVLAWKLGVNWNASWEAGLQEPDLAHLPAYFGTSRPPNTAQREHRIRVSASG